MFHKHKLNLSCCKIESYDVHSKKVKTEYILERYDHDKVAEEYKADTEKKLIDTLTRSLAEHILDTNK